MKGTGICKKLRTSLVLAICIGVLAVPGIANAYTTTCPSGSQQLVSVTYSVTGESVTGANGNVWATADYTRTLLVFRVSGNTYCANWRDSGTFTTLDGTSPAGTGHVDAGITGSLTRTAVTTNFKATWRPTKPTSGDIGTYAAPVDWTSFYFSNVQAFDFVWYANLYTTSANGSWGSRTGFPSYGDIVS